MFPEVHVVPQGGEELYRVTKDGEVESASGWVPVHDCTDGGRVPDAVEAVYVVAKGQFKYDVYMVE